MLGLEIHGHVSKAGYEAPESEKVHSSWKEEKWKLGSRQNWK